VSIRSNFSEIRPRNRSDPFNSGHIRTGVSYRYWQVYGITTCTSFEYPLSTLLGSTDVTT
jgi:hypothetical protein